MSVVFPLRSIPTPQVGGLCGEYGVALLSFLSSETQGYERWWFDSEENKNTYRLPWCLQPVTHLSTQSEIRFVLTYIFCFVTKAAILLMKTTVPLGEEVPSTAHICECHIMCACWSQEVPY